MTTLNRLGCTYQGMMDYLKAPKNLSAAVRWDSSFAPGYLTQEIYIHVDTVTDLQMRHRETAHRFSIDLNYPCIPSS